MTHDASPRRLDFSDDEIQSLRAKIVSNHTVNEKTGCWDWDRNRNQKGYGLIWVNKKYAQVHRVSHFCFNGPFDQQMCVCHKCDRPICCNPEHLFAGSQKENIQDAVQKNRMAFGVRHHLAKLDPEKVKEIVAMRLGGMSTYEIASLVGIDRASVCSVLNGETWKKDSGVGDVSKPLPKRMFTQFGKRKEILNEDQKVEICSRVGTGESAKKIAEEFDMCLVHVYRIAKDPKYWRHNFQRQLSQKKVRSLMVNDEMVRKIFHLASNGETGRDIGVALKINEQTVGAILRGKRYTHLAPEIPRPFTRQTPC